MPTKPNQFAYSRTLISSAALWALLAAFATGSNAQGWELRTASTSVPGTREIESGRIDKAIRISEAHLSIVSQRNKVAVLNNLCIGYILRDELETASGYCDKAVERPNEKTVSHNNRGVLKALQGNVEGAIQDFDKAAKAGCLGECSAYKNVPRDLPRPVANRNFAKAEMIAKEGQTTEKNGLAARAAE